MQTQQGCFGNTVILNSQNSQGTVAAVASNVVKVRRKPYMGSFLGNTNYTIVKEFWKPVNICWSCDKKSKGLFFYWNTVLRLLRCLHGTMSTWPARNYVIRWMHVREFALVWEIHRHLLKLIEDEGGKLSHISYINKVIDYVVYHCSNNLHPSL